MGELCDQIDGLQKQLKWAEEQLAALNADHDLVLADNERLNIRIAALEADKARLVAALDTALAGGNDIANMLIDRLGHDFASRFPPDLSPEHSEIGFSDTYALWCVWRAMMIARAELDAMGGGDECS